MGNLKGGIWTKPFVDKRNSMALIQRRLHWPREGGSKNRFGVFEWRWQLSAYHSKKSKLAVGGMPFPWIVPQLLKFYFTNITMPISILESEDISKLFRCIQLP
jgi:hypothetical protein